MKKRCECCGNKLVYLGIARYNSLTLRLMCNYCFENCKYLGNRKWEHKDPKWHVDDGTRQVYQW
jgi:hypothetical protein